MSAGSSVRRIGAGVPYVDGSEAHLLTVLRGCADLSSGSDELDAHIVDWPTRYHLSHQRTNLLRPLDLPRTARVLDVGAGTGALARYLGERVASVVALEGNMARAEVAAERCRDLPSVEVLCGSIGDLDPSARFDVIIVVGVLEYAGAAIGGGAGAAALLAAVHDRLAPGGAMVLAIENQLGLKYLLGGAEDHRGQPWVGIEGYPGPPGVRTWSRRELAGMLQEHGFADQCWLAPFPDYKLPSLVLHEALYGEPDREALIDQLVLHPVVFLDAVPARLGDAPAAHRTFVRAGLGLDVACSFLVVASPDPGGAGRLVPEDRLAWLFGGHRRSPWRRHRVLTADRRLLRDSDGRLRAEAWLRQRPGEDRAFEVGRTLGQDVDAALRAHDLDALQRVLQRWWAEIVGRSGPAPDLQAVGLPHPFLHPDTTRVLPPDHLDVGPSNFVDRGGELVLIDDEWEASGPVDLEMAAARALWVVSHDVVTSGMHHPWDAAITVGEVFDRLLAMLPLDLPSATFDAFTSAELALQSMVAGSDPAEIERTWLDRSMSGITFRPDERERRELLTLREVVPSLEERVGQAVAAQDAARQVQGALEEQVAAQAHELERRATLPGFARARLARSARLRRVVDRVRAWRATR